MVVMLQIGNVILPLARPPEPQGSHTSHVYEDVSLGMQWVVCFCIPSTIASGPAG